MELLSTVRVRCPSCGFEWRLIGGEWHLNSKKTPTKKARLTEWT